ncbi:MAG TPA: RecX family transcriptional regulator [Candidatus Pristimantibacillus sp.]|nr:RecX family transcriptional regulator [Candidatus Pristimantibacillus sp.]
MKITAIKQQVKRTDRYSIFVDEKYAFSLSESGLIESRLASGQELDAAELKRLKEAAGLDKAYYNALRYVAIRPRSEWEIEMYLARKDADKAVSQEVIRRLRNLNLLSDLDFARSWINNRRALKSTSKRRLRLELLQKHVPDDIVAEALAEDETDERDALRQLVEKKRRRYPDQQKLMQYLARQGFSYDDIKSVLSEEDES